jgi:hypothetical protein
MKTSLAVLVMLFLGTVPAGAALGEYESSVSLDQQVLRGEIRQVVGQGFRLHQITSPNGAVIREYVSPEGKVFGISWQAPSMPNLRQLLGSYAAEVEQAAQSKARRGGPLIVRSNDLVFVSGGHMRFFRGRAYLPGLLPKNVSAEVVR